MAIWVLKDGQREGPYQEQDVRELIYEGTYSDEDAAISDGQYDWSTLGEILGRERAESEPLYFEPQESFTGEPLVFEPPPELAAAPEDPESEPPPMPVLPPEPPATEPRAMPVAVVDFRMPFGSMVVFMVKWVIASIPALLILFAMAALFWSGFIALIAMVTMLLRR